MFPFWIDAQILVMHIKQSDAYLTTYYRTLVTLMQTLPEYFFGVCFKAPFPTSSFY